MATNAQFEPYEYYDGDQIVGIDADIAKAICDKLGYELKIEDMELMRSSQRYLPEKLILVLPESR